MFFHNKGLQFEAQPDAPDPLYAKKLQEILGGAWGEITVATQYLFQGWNCRLPGKYKDMLLDIGTEELAHVEMLATMIGKLLEGAPADVQDSEAAKDPVLAAVLSGMNPQHPIVGGLGAAPADSTGYPWNGRYIVASGNLLADFRANVTAESQGRLQAARLYHMTDDRGVKDLLAFLIARDAMHQNQWLAAIEELKEDGLDDTPVPEAFPPDEQNADHAYTYWSLSDGDDSAQGRWAQGPTPDGRGQFSYLADPVPLAGKPTPPAGSPELYVTGADHRGLIAKAKDAVT